MQTVWVPGSACWARDRDRAYAEASVVAVRGSDVDVALLNPDAQGAEERHCKAEDLLPRCADQRCIAEMDELQELNPASVLNNVELLFGQTQGGIPGQGPNTIYSSVGPVLIAMNPFTQLPLYGEQWVKAYRAASGNPTESKALGPHCYRTVDEAYRNLKVASHQSVVICGESGAGKTVTNRKMLEYLVQVAQKPTGAKAHAVGADPQQITEANVLLEAFGNAKTTRNNNSSRFGRYTQLFFDREAGYAILGCSVEHYLLERSRVVAQPHNERNYHIFYQLLKSGAGKKYGLEGDSGAYAYTQDESPVPGVNDAEDFRLLSDTMLKAGFDEATKEHIFSSVVAVLLLGNVEFTGSIDSSKVDPGTSGVLGKACTLLGIEADKLSKALVSNYIKPPVGAPIQTDISLEAARAQRDAVAKTIYSRLFDFIIAFIGQTLQKGGPGDGTAAGAAAIGLLDIFGFEDMMHNGFEQMFINLTNERIQHLFNSIMFERELAAYRSEGITAAFDPGVGNLECVKLFTSPSNPPGIVRLLGESAFMKSGRDDAGFVQVLNSAFARHPSYKVCDPQDAQRAARAKGLSRLGTRRGLSLDYRECFQVRHYAGTVLYTVKGWVPKSIDALHPHLSKLLAASEKPGIRQLFEKEEEAYRATVGEKFCAQLEVLAETLEQGETLFVRCIKSNPQMVPGLVNRPLVLEQLVHGGVIAALEMRHRGLPERMGYEAFCSDYGMLWGHRSPDRRVHCQAVLEGIFGAATEGDVQYAFGHTKVFMKSNVGGFLRAAAALRLRNLAKRVQRNWRLHMGTERIRKVEEAWQQLLAAKTLAQAKGIETLPGVARSLGEGEAKIGAVFQRLEAARKAHGTNIQQIANALPAEDTRPLYGLAEGVTVVVERVSKRKVAAEELLGLRLTRAMDTISRLLARVAAMEHECEEVADVVDASERERFTSACTGVRERLSTLQKKDLPEVRSLGPVGVELESEGLPALAECSISPRLNELMESVKAKVAEVEGMGHEVLRVRRAFQQAVQEVSGQEMAAQEALEALQEQVQQYLTQGLDAVVAQVNVAWQRQVEAQELLKAAKDADGYRAAVEAFVAAVRQAERALEEGRQELARRAAEEEERRALQAQLDSLLHQLGERRTLVHKSLEVQLGGSTPGAAKANAGLEALLEEIPPLRHAAREGLDGWRTRIEDVAKRSAAVIADVDSQLVHATRARQEEFARRMSKFNATPEKAKAEEAPIDPAAFLRAEGLVQHEGPLLEILQLMQSMQEAGAPRSGVQRCMTHWVKNTWGVTGRPSLQLSPSR